ncbi:MAG: hypothetical protein HYT80_02115 [Euryarchaeota archaeon]|nr:hypothetical protein [Euryarchaeota archaeon]
MTTSDPLEPLAARAPPEQRIVLAALLREAVAGPVVLVGASAYEFYTCGVDPHPRMEVSTDRARAAGVLKEWGFNEAGTALVHRGRGLAVELHPHQARGVPYIVAGRTVHVSGLVETLVDLLAASRQDRAWKWRAELLARAHRGRLDGPALLSAAEARGLRPFAEEVLRAAGPATRGAGTA